MIYVCLALIVLLAWQNRQFAHERAELRRLQTPGATPQPRKKGPKTPARVIAFDDDKALSEAIEARNGGANSGEPD